MSSEAQRRQAASSTDGTESVEQLILRATSHYAGECDELSFLPELRFDRTVFPTVGQYDWLAGQVLYCLVRETRPRKIIEFSTSSGYSTTFTALALKRNGTGVVHTVDIDAAAQAAARRWFEKKGVASFVSLHHGDCREIVPGLLDDNVDILFIDSLHSFDIACWYLDRIIPRLHPDALVHVHDVMPPEARVRIHGGPPFPPDVPAPRLSVLHLLKRLAWLVLHLQNPNPFPRQLPRELMPLDRLELYRPAEPNLLPTIDGNYFEEAVLIRELLRDSAPVDFVYLHRLMDHCPALSPQRFAGTDKIGRTDARGAALEWNDALWARAGSLAARAEPARTKELRRKLVREYAITRIERYQ